MRSSLTLLFLLSIHFILSGQDKYLHPDKTGFQYGSGVESIKVPYRYYVPAQTIASTPELIQESAGMSFRLDSTIGMTPPVLPGNNHLMSKVEYTYNSLQLNTQQTEYMRDTLLQVWIPQQRWSFTYHQNNRHYLSSVISERWDSLSQSWIDVFGYDYDYDGAFNLIRITYLRDTIGSGILKPNYKTELIYAGLPLKRTESFHYLSTGLGTWTVTGKMEIVYDGTSDRILQNNYRYWHDSTSSWSPVYYKTEYTYNPDFSLDSRISYQFNEASSQFYPRYGDHYSYHSSGKISGIVHSDNNNMMNQYLPSSKMERSFTSGGLVDWYKESLYMPLIQQWDTARITTFIRDSSAAVYSLLLPYWIEIDTDLVMNVFGAGMILETPCWEWNSATSGMVNTLTSNYYYSSQITSIHGAEKPSAKIYPNPVKDWLNIDISESTFYKIRIIDLQGRKILEKPFSGSMRLDMTGLKNGIYLFRIVDGKDNTVYQGKVMVLR
jgi:hypothetical protein